MFAEPDPNYYDARGTCLDARTRFVTVKSKDLFNLAHSDALFLLPSAVRRDPAVDAWLDLTDPMRMIVQPWFERMRALGQDVCETLHDHMPTACVGEAAFAYVNAFTAHAAVGFFNGASLPDPEGLLEGSGKRMRHVKLRPGDNLDEQSVQALIDAAYADVKRRLG